MTELNDYLGGGEGMSRADDLKSYAYDLIDDDDLMCVEGEAILAEAERIIRELEQEIAALKEQYHDLLYQDHDLIHLTPPMMLELIAVLTKMVNGEAPK